LKTRVLGFQKLSPTQNQSQKLLSPTRPTHKRGASSGAILISPIKQDSVFNESVFYIGKVTLPQQQVPPHFIDKVLVHLNKNQDQTDSPLMPNKNALRRKRFSLDVQPGIY